MKKIDTYVYKKETKLSFYENRPWSVFTKERSKTTSKNFEQEQNLVFMKITKLRFYEKKQKFIFIKRGKLRVYEEKLIIVFVEKIYRVFHAN
jgi:hypothetical protein